MKLLLISNSTNAGEEYLKYPIAEIKAFLDDVSQVIFIPYAAVSFSYDVYEAKVQERFDEIGVEVISTHRLDSPAEAIATAKAIVVGGGNTFALVKQMQEEGLMEVIKRRVDAGVPFVGWSAGSNVCCPTLCTTNDMPIVQPKSFKTLGVVKFQINPHYMDHNPEGHAGETREQRIEEYIAANRDIYVVGLREGSMLRVNEDEVSLIGERSLRVFKYGEEPTEIEVGGDLRFLL